MVEIADLEDIAEQYLIWQRSPAVQLEGADDCSPHEMRFESGFDDRRTKESRRLHHLPEREKRKLREEFYKFAGRY